MKVDTSGLSLDRLGAHLGAAYRVAAARIAFVPKGEDGYGYEVAAADGRRLWLRVQARHPGQAARALAALPDLAGQDGLDAIVAPIPTRRGRSTSRLDGRTVALFPFVEGVSAYERAPTDAQVAGTARAMAALHACPPPAGLRHVGLRDPYGPTIRRLLREAGQVASTPGGYAARVRDQLALHRADVLAALRLADELGARLAGRSTPPVVLHGDPNWANVLLGADGRVHLVDWGGLCLGPREWDLAHLTGDRFDLFLDAYLAAAGPVALDEEAFFYHGYRWALQEIADYVGRILLGPDDAAEHAHAWAELQPYLPVPHAAIAAEADRAAAVLRASARR